MNVPTEILTVESNGPEIVGVPVEDMVQAELPQAPRQADEPHPQVALSVVQVCDTQ